MELFRRLNRMVGMGRLPRVHYAGAVYHAMARGVEGRDIYRDDSDRKDFLRRLHHVESEASAKVIAYCLMGNHFHLAIKVGLVPLSSVMHRLLTGYAKFFNERYERAGHLFQGRHRAKLCRSDRYLYQLIHYIHMNPVRAGFVSHPGDWEWSSYKTVRGALKIPQDFDPWGDDTEEMDLTRSLDIEKPDLDVIGSEISGRTGIRLAELRSASRNRSVVAARRLITLEAVVRGHALISVAKWLNTTRSSVSRYATARSNIATTGGQAPIWVEDGVR